MNAKYALPEPDFNSELVGLLFEVERLRANIGTGDTPLEVDIELHRLFDLVMSVVSARIEGNHTTVYEALERSSAPPATPSARDRLREIENITEAVRYIDSFQADVPLTHTFIRDLHTLTVDGLEREGDPSPGEYRQIEVKISGSHHTPPLASTLHAEMSELLDFANADYELRQQMLQIALAHHRLVWIHPFVNGNGRVSRLFTYAMLRKTIFASRGYSALNPTSVFGNDRSAYIAALEQADSLTPDGDTMWSTFFTRGIRDDLQRLVQLQNHAYVMAELIQPVLAKLVVDGVIDTQTAAVLFQVARNGSVKAGDLTEVIPGNVTQRSREIRSLLDRGLLRQAPAGPRFYQLHLSGGPLSFRLIRRLDELGLLPKMLSND